MSKVLVPLHQVAHGRAGDKGNRSNISLIAYRPESFEYLCNQITEKLVLDLFSHKGASKVSRYELPKLHALNFVIDDVLEGGVNDGLCIDGHGKTLAFLLLGSLSIELPEAIAAYS